MKFKVTATYYVDAANWVEAENKVENKQELADQIESDPVGKSPRDYIMFGISTKIHDMHNKIFFEPETDKTYEEKLAKLRNEASIWLDNLLEEVIRSNESNWV